MAALFIDRDNKEYSAEDVYESLISIGAHDCDALFIHSDIMLGRTPPGFKRAKYLEELEQVFLKLGVRSLIFPTFTYSFCNNEAYDVNVSKTSMGAFNEYMRKREGRYRTLDPLLSVSVPESLRERFENPGDNSLGQGSALDVLHNTDGVKFLFFGVRMGCCFTYLHYIEKMLDVKYRFDMPFEGKIIDHSGNCFSKTQYIHTACFGVKPADFYYFEDEMEEKGFLNKVRLGDSLAACISEKDAYREISDKIHGNINYFLEKPFTDADLEHRYTKGLDGSRVTHC